MRIGTMAAQREIDGKPLFRGVRKHVFLLVVAGLVLHDVLVIWYADGIPLNPGAFDRDDGMLQAEETSTKLNPFRLSRTLIAEHRIHRADLFSIGGSDFGSFQVKQSVHCE